MAYTREQWADYRERNREKLRQNSERYNRANKDKISEAARIRYNENLESAREYNRNKAQRLKAQRQDYKRQWMRENKGRVNASTAKRRANLIQATPKWANLEAIRDFYKNCPEGYHVDHIVPLRNKLVCGLHVLENLQYLPGIDCRKNNRFEVSNV